VADDPGGDRVLEDVLQRRFEVLVALDRLRVETLAEDVVAPPVDGVERMGVLAVEVAHPVGEVRLGRLDDEVVMRAEQAARVEAPAVAAHDAAQLVQEGAAVVVVQEAEPFVVAARRDVVPGAGGEVATLSGHPATVARSSRRQPRRDEAGTRSLRLGHVPGTRRGRYGHVDGG
jgi:hypothetical protein